jgi:MoxR-like ATPase
MVVLTEHDGRIVRPHANFRIFASMNPSEEGRYGGTKMLNEALMDRFPVVIRMEYLPLDKEVEAVMVQSENDDRELVERMVNVAHDVREAIRNEKVFGSFSTRRVIDWARMAKTFDPRESADYTVLSKMSSFDAEAVEDIIDLYF